MKNIFWDGVLLIFCVALFLIVGFELRNKKVKSIWIILLAVANMIIFASIPSVVCSMSLLIGWGMTDWLEWRESK